MSGWKTTQRRWKMGPRKGQIVQEVLSFWATLATTRSRKGGQRWWRLGASRSNEKYEPGTVVPGRVRVAASHFSVFAFVISQFSDGRTAECAAAPWHHMVESLLLHGYVALSTTLPSTVTIWCVLHADCTALVPHTKVEGHSAFRSRPARSRHSVL